MYIDYASPTPPTPPFMCTTRTRTLSRHADSAAGGHSEDADPSAGAISCVWHFWRLSTSGRRRRRKQNSGRRHAVHAMESCPMTCMKRRVFPIASADALTGSQPCCLLFGDDGRDLCDLSLR